MPTPTHHPSLTAGTRVWVLHRGRITPGVITGTTRTGRLRVTTTTRRWRPIRTHPQHCAPRLTGGGA